MGPAELLGYAASLLIIGSVSRTSILQLRILGFIGALTFMTYGLIIGAWPVALTNVVLAGLHGYFLIQMSLRTREFFTSLPLRKDSQYLRHFLEFYGDDIRDHQPGYEFVPADDQIRAFVLRDMAPAGVFIGRGCDDGSIEIELDYVIPKYRDLKVARYLYSEQSGIFNQVRDRRIWTAAGSEAHVDYFERLGFDHANLDDQPVLISDIGDLIT